MTITVAPPNPSGLCGCGCGRKTTIAAKNDTFNGHARGHPIRFIIGHNGRKSPVPFIIDPDTGCWEWQRGKHDLGYGNKYDPIAKRQVKAHVWWYEQVIGKVPDGLELDHLCRNPGCVNPDHLEPVTHAENLRRGANAILTMEKAREIRQRYRNGSWSCIWAACRGMASEYGVAAQTIQSILSGRQWKEATDVG